MDRNCKASSFLLHFQKPSIYKKFLPLPPTSAIYHPLSTVSSSPQKEFLSSLSTKCPQPPLYHPSPSPSLPLLPTHNPYSQSPYSHYCLHPFTPRCNHVQPPKTSETTQIKNLKRLCTTAPQPSKNSSHISPSLDAECPPCSIDDVKKINRYKKKGVQSVVTRKKNYHPSSSLPQAPSIRKIITPSSLIFLSLSREA